MSDHSYHGATSPTRNSYNFDLNCVRTEERVCSELDAVFLHLFDALDRLRGRGRAGPHVVLVRVLAHPLRILLRSGEREKCYI